MSPLLNEIARHITGRNDLQSCSQQELETLVNKYPAFSSAHILLAAKSGRDAAVGKAQLFFTTGLWNQSLLGDDKNGDAVFTGAAPAVDEPATTATPIHAALETPFTDEQPLHQANPEVAEPEVEKAVFKDSLPAELEKPFTDEHPLNQVGNTKDAEEALAPETTQREIEIRVPADLPSVAELTGAKTTDPSSAPVSDTLAFEPYHTVDYFASQGIRFKDEQKDKDRFSVQLRSFTDWLKTMKRIPASEIAPATSVSEEKRVEQMAAVSISPREVVTEAMAEVWEKQGNRDKAIHIYKKLSLLDPAKSAYFAAKIEQLKHS